MLVRHLTISVAIHLGAKALEATSAQALTMKECSAKYKEAKAAGTLNGMKWNDFRKSQCGAEVTAPPAAGTPPAAESKPAPAPTTAEKPVAEKPVSDGRKAEYARERACGKEWKAAKAAGTRPPGMKWPQYWSECDKRKKAEGM